MKDLKRSIFELKLKILVLLNVDRGRDPKWIDGYVAGQESVLRLLEGETK